MSARATYQAHIRLLCAAKRLGIDGVLMRELDTGGFEVALEAGASAQLLAGVPGMFAIVDPDDVRIIATAKSLRKAYRDAAETLEQEATTWPTR